MSDPTQHEPGVREGPKAAGRAASRALGSVGTLLVAALGLAAVGVLVAPDRVFALWGLDAGELARPATARESLREAVLITAAAVALGSGLAVGLLGSFRALRGPRFLLAALLVALLVHVLSLSRVGYVADDACVHFVYARNLAGHGELAFNLGERAEGYRSLLLVVLLAPFARLPRVFSPVAMAQGIGLAAALPTVWLLYAIGRRLAPERAPGWSLVAPLLLSLFPSFVLAPAMGGEAPLVTFLVTLGACLYLAHPAGRRSVWWPLALAAAVLARPDAVVFLLAAIVFELGRTRARPRALLALAARCLPGAALVVAYRLWAAHVHGHVLPSALLASGATRLSAGRAFQGAYTVGSFLVRLGGAVLLLVPAAAAAGCLDRRLGWPAFVAAASLLHVVLVGGDSVPGHRLLLPATPLLLLLLQESAAGLCGRLARGRRRTPLRLVLALAVVAALAVPYFRREAAAVRQLARLRDGSARVLGDLVPRLRGDAHHAASIALADAGRLKFHSDRPVLDLTGRCAPAIATLGADAAREVVRRRPTFIVLAASQPRDDGTGRALAGPVERRIHRAAELHTRTLYVHEATITRHEPTPTTQGQYLWVYRLLSG